jgi:hypothetical protein
VSEVDGTDVAAAGRNAGSVIVLGGGLLGAAVARKASAGGATVTVASRTPRPHPGLWRSVALDDVQPADLAGLLGAAHGRGPRAGGGVAGGGGPPSAPKKPSVHLVWAVSFPDDDLRMPGTVLPRVVEHALRAGVDRVTICGPFGRGLPALDAFDRAARDLARPGVTVARLPALFGTDDRLAWPLVQAIDDRGMARIPRGLPASWPLWVEDAARAALALPEGDHTLRGPQRMEFEEIAETVVAAVGGRWGWRLFGGRAGAPRLAAQVRIPDHWDEVRLGARTLLSAWLGRLPRARRRR